MSALPWFERLAQASGSLPDAWTAKYLGQMTVPVPITDQARAVMPANSLAATLVLIEIYQKAERLDEAIGLAQQLHEAMPDDDVVKLSLADLLYADGDDDGVVELVAGVDNQDDVSLAMVILRAKALSRKGMATGAASELTAAMKRTSGRDAELLREARYHRGIAYEAAGQEGKARADLEKVYAEQPAYRDVRERLASLSA